jgi:predicted transposase/invertase (TIGR01784 family)
MKSNIWYDESCKKLLANKSILYNILKRVLPEYQNLSFEEMMPLFSDITDSYTLESRNTEDSFVPNESIHYDVLLYCRLPASNEGIIVNLEVQANMPAYSILKRGIYYLGRLIARQKRHEYGFKKSEYNHLKKGISIWICNTPKHLKGMLNKYSIDEQNMTLPYSFSKMNYDLMQLIVISPETKPSHQHGIIDFLSLLFGENLDFTSSLQRLENEYGVILDKQEKEEMHKMCNWSIAHYQNGLEQGLQQGENNGVLKEMKNTIQRMVHAGFNLEVIAIATGKNIDEVKTLVQQLS